MFRVEREFLEQVGDEISRMGEGKNAKNKNGEIGDDVQEDEIFFHYESLRPNLRPMQYKTTQAHAISQASEIVIAETRHFSATKNTIISTAASRNVSPNQPQTFCRSCGFSVNQGSIDVNSLGSKFLT